MNYATPEAIEAARRIDLYSYLHEREPQELVKCGNGVYCTRTHDSLKISRGKWFWWSHGIGGHTALDYLIRVRGMRLPDAVEILAGTTCAVLPPPRAAPPPPEKRLMQLPHNDSCDRVRRYLTGRGLDAEIVDCMIAEGRRKTTDSPCFTALTRRESPVNARQERRTEPPSSGMLQEVTADSAFVWRQRFLAGRYGCLRVPLICFPSPR